MTPARLSRRQLMHILSVGAGAYAYGRHESHWGVPGALGAAAPARFVYFNVPHGVLGYEDFVKNGGSETSFELGPMTAPLEKVKEHLVVLDNIELVKVGGGACTHNIGMVQMTTGAKSPADNINADNRCGGPSIDHVLKTKIGSKTNPACPSLILAAQGPSYSFDDAGRRGGAIGNPVDVYAKYLMGLTAGEPSAMKDPALVKRLKTRAFVLDSVAKDVEAFRKTLPADARERADAQLGVLQSLSARVDAAMNAPAAPTCRAAKPPAFDSANSAEFPRVARLHTELLAATLACDVTRIGMLGFRGIPASIAQRCNFEPVNRPDLAVHPLSHTDIAKDGGKAFRAFKALCFGMIADFAETLSKIPEPITGGSMLDNTIILCGTGIGAGHSQSGLQLAVIGGKNLGIKTGRLLRLGTAREPNKGIRVNKVLVSVMNAMGLSVDTFNATSDQSNKDVPRSAFEGPVPGLRG